MISTTLKKKKKGEWEREIIRDLFTQQWPSVTTLATQV